MARFERATPSVSAIVFTACRSAPTRVSATAVFLALPDPAPRAGSQSPRSFCRAAVAARVLGSARLGTPRLAPPPRPHPRRSAPSGVAPPSAVRLIGRNTVPARHQRHRHPGRVGLRDDRRLFFRRPAPLPMNRREGAKGRFSSRSKSGERGVDKLRLSAANLAQVARCLRDALAEGNFQSRRAILRQG